MTVVSAGVQALVAGPPGKSAYQLAVDNGFVGTVTQWLASLQGQTGATGAPGAAGPAGPVVVSVPYKNSAASLAIPSGYTYIGITALTGSGCALTLPSASTYVAGSLLHIVDETGLCSGTLPITVSRAGSDTIAGQTSEQMVSAYQRLTLMSNGVNLWTIL